MDNSNGLKQQGLIIRVKSNIQRYCSMCQQVSQLTNNTANISISFPFVEEAAINTL